MATKFANVKSVQILEEPLGSDHGGVARVTFDLLNLAYTGGTDVVQLGGGGQEQAATSTATLVAMIQGRRRDGKTVVLLGALGGPDGAQAAATNGPKICAQTPAVSGANVTLNLFNALTGGAAITTTVATWDRAASLYVTYTAT